MKRIDYLRTERHDVVLRRYTPADAPTIFALIDSSREHLSQHGENTAKKYPTLETLLASIQYPTNLSRLRMSIWVGACEPAGQQVVGAVNITPKEPGRAEIGYWLCKTAIGKGYMTAAVQAITAYAFSQDILAVYGDVRPKNKPSRQVLERAGYRQVPNPDKEQMLRYMIEKK